MNRRKFLLLAGASAAETIFDSGKTDLGAAYAQKQNSPDFTLHIGSVSHELAPGAVVSTFGYNGSVPGPLLRMKEGKPVDIEVFNDTDTPDLVHWHGLAIDSVNDGAMEEGSPMIGPHRKFRYSFTPNPSGSRWYHTHNSARVDASHVDLSRGAYSGQFGFLYVDPKNDEGHYDHEVFLAVHHWEPTLMHMGELFTGCPITYKYASFNGKLLSAAEPLKVKKGDRVLFHFLNSSATETVNLALPNHQFKVLALDGNPVPNQQIVSTISLAVAERVDAIVEMNFAGVWILGSTSEEERGKGLGLPVEYAGSAGPAVWIDPASKDWGYTKFGKSPLTVVPDATFAMRFEKIPGKKDVLDRWTINGKSFPEIENIKVHEGGRYRFSFFNASNESHPVHIHRHTFEVMSIAGKGSSGIMKDVINVEPYHKVEVDMIANNPGLTLLHCHHQLHMDYGFMQMIRYV
jgi:FtsP/CotA-like multicopper oxidase with cupredoxin domain